MDQKQIEIFLCSVIINSLEIESFRAKHIYAHFQMNDMPLLNLTNFDVSEGKTQVELYKGIQFIVRLNCLDSFKTCPAYIYFDNNQSQTICACGLDLTSLIVDSYRHSNSGKPELYQTNLVLHNRYDKEIGLGNFLFTCLHFSKDVNNVKSCVNFVEERKPIEESTGAVPQDIQLGDNFLKSVCTMARVPRRQTPIMKDLLVLSHTYQKTRSNAVNEVENLVNEIQTIEAKKNVKIQKRRQEKRRLKEPFENVEDTIESVHTSDFSYFENSSEYSVSQRINQAFDNCEEKCGVSHTFHFKHHGKKPRPKHHHHHHHHKDDHDTKSEAAKPEPTQSVSSQHQSKTLNKTPVSNTKPMANEVPPNRAVTQHNFDAFIKRQEAAAEKKKSFMSNSGIDNKSGISQASTTSKKKNKKNLTQKKKLDHASEANTILSNKTTNEKNPSISQPAQESTFATEIASQHPHIPTSTKPTEPEQNHEDAASDESNSTKVIDFPSDTDKKEENREDSSHLNDTDTKNDSHKEEISAFNDTDIRSQSSKAETIDIEDSEKHVSNKTDESNKDETIDLGDTEKKNDKSENNDISMSFISASDSKANNDVKSKSFIESISAIDDAIIESPSGTSNPKSKVKSHDSDSSSKHEIDSNSNLDDKNSSRISFTGSTIDIDDGEVVDIEPNSIISGPPNTLEPTTNDTISREEDSHKKENIDDTDSFIDKSFISKKDHSDDGNKANHDDLKDLDIDKLLADTDTEQSSLPSDLKNILGTDVDSPPPVKKVKKEEKVIPKIEPKPAPPKPEEPSSQTEGKSGTSHRRMSSTISGIDMDLILSS